MERKITFSDGEFYHVYNRGVDKRSIFTRELDYQRFLALLYIANDDASIHMANLFKRKSTKEILELNRGKRLVSIGAFCMMPNHYHLLLTQNIEGGISKFLLKLQTAYSMYFNIRNERSGALFQGVFRAEHVDSDEYLQYLYAYIHLNPAAIKDKKWKTKSLAEISKVRTYIEQYPYSSYGEYLEGKQVITNPTPFPQYFRDIGDFKKMHDFWLDSSSDVQGFPLK